MLRNAKTFERIKKMILKGMYIKEELILDMNDFLEIGTLTQKEYDELILLIEKHPSARFTIDEDGVLKSNNTYKLLKKQIDKQIYDIDTVEQIVTDFRVTGAITREDFKELIALIDTTYNK